MVGHIELFGLPAAGKTTVLKALQPAAAELGLRLLVPLPGAPATLREKWDKARRDWTAVARMQVGARKDSWAIWHACRQFEQPTANQQLRMYLNCLRLEGLIHRSVRGAGPGSVIALDQGLFQALWSLALRADFRDPSGFERAAARLLEAMTRPDLVILVDTPPDLARHRLEREPRGHGRLLGLIAEDPAWMDRASARLQTIWALCRRHPEVETFHLTPADLDAPALVGLIKRRCHPAGEERRRA